MLESGDIVVVGVSGGADSLCLLNVLYRLKEELSIQLYVVHINHCLRGSEADLDEEFVTQYAKKLNLRIFTRKIDVKEYAKSHKMTLEEAGREVRYSFFEEVSLEVQANKIAVAHNINDHVETFLFNLIRGTGMEGLKGIEPVRGRIIRPLIETDRSQIELYCQENELTPRIDATNFETIYTRNKIRLELIPYLKKNFNTNIINSINRTSELIYDENTFLCIMAEKCYTECLLEENKEIIRLSLKKYNQLHISLKRRIIRIAIEKLEGELKAVEKIHIENALEILAEEKTGTRAQIPKGIEIKIEYDKMVITKEKCKKEIIFSYEIVLSGEVEIPELSSKLIARIIKVQEIKNIKKDKYTCLLDYEKILKQFTEAASSEPSTLNLQLSTQGFLVVRNRRSGDVINPSGMVGTKKLKDYFIDEKASREERMNSPLIAYNKEIIWIIGRRYTDKYKVDNTTKEVLVLEYRTSE